MSEILHGGRLDQAIAMYGGAREDWIDLSTGINPNAYPVPDIPPDFWSRLPGAEDERRLIEEARRYYGVPDDFDVVPANGTQALIQLLPGITQYGEVSIVSPTYAEHAHVWRQAGYPVRQVPKLSDIPSSSRTAIVVNPNNPDARIHSSSEICKACEKLEVMIVDEAFCDTCPENSILDEPNGQIVVLKSFGKFFGLAGLRLGFAVCRPELASQLTSQIGPWAVSGPALVIGRTAISDRTWIERTRAELDQASKRLATTLEDCGLNVEGVNPLFVFVQCDEAAALQTHLAKHHILVRHFPEWPTFLRFGLCKDEADLDRLAAVLKGYRHG